MASEEKQLLLKDLCARLPYRVKFRFELSDGSYRTIDLQQDTLINFDQEYCFWILRGDIMPYLRSMSSMTEEEKREEPVGTSLDGFMYPYEAVEYVDWLNAHHFDYRGLIEKGLALEAPKGMYKDS